MSRSIYYTALITERLDVNRIGDNHSDKPKICNQNTTPQVKPDSYRLKGGCLLFVLANNPNRTDRLKYLGTKEFDINGKITSDDG